MPFIHTLTTKKITDDVRKELKTEYGKIIAEIPGKSEKWLMLAFTDETKMYFHGDDSDDCAYIEVNIFGGASDDAYDRLTARICVLISDKLNVPADRIYVKYEEAEHWGWNGANF